MVLKNKLDAMDKRKLSIKKEELLHLFNSGLSDKDIADVFNTTAIKIKYKRYYYGIVREPIKNIDYFYNIEFLCTVKSKFNISF